MQRPITERVPMPGRITVRRALISVWDKTGVVDLAAALVSSGADILSTGGTGSALREAGLPVTTIESITGYPSILDGRVKTLHPAVFAAVLGRDDPAHRDELAGLGITPVDLVVVNLYPFEGLAEDAPPEEAVELIDIGGVALIRAAAKNWERVGVVCDPAQYAVVAAEFQETGGLSVGTRRGLAADAFSRTAAYDSAIAGYFARQTGRRFPEFITLAYRKLQDTRYGENPHQSGAFYRRHPPGSRSLVDAEQLQGKELSYNNIVDLDAAWGLAAAFTTPAAAIIKHATPCGAAIGNTLADAYAAALRCDPVSAFGGVVALNRIVDGPAASAIAEVFTEVIVAPGFSTEAREIFKKKTNLRLLVSPPPADGPREVEVKHVRGGVLLQDPDVGDAAAASPRVVTPRTPTPEERRDLEFAWIVARWVKSNAIVFGRGGATVGIGAGQPNRVGAVEIAARVAGERARGAVMASDAFFPFRDGLDAAARAGITAVIQPGGSVRDEEIIAAATEHGMAMIFTGTRHFRH
ncbi:MAG TPA: bifunctional phosphoribosylaminoimidazolecarboxamide formyltransferase/IMP cyclohydrolase [bacterium]